MLETAKYASRWRCVFQASVATRSPGLTPSFVSACASLRRAAGDLAPRRSMDGALDGARDDFGVAVEARRELDLARDEQRLVHHLSEHVRLLEVRSATSDVRVRSAKSESSPKSGVESESIPGEQRARGL